MSGERKSLDTWRDTRTRSVYDLEVSLLYSALHSFKKTSVVNPFPKGFKKSDGDRDYSALQRVTDALPPPHLAYGNAAQIPPVSPEGDHLLSFLQEHSNLRETRDWSDLEPHLANVDAVYRPQYLFSVEQDTDSQRHKDFSTAAKEFEPQIAFHGSPTGNWYSIAKTGLRNLNGLRAPAHGTLFGEGIYLSKTLRLASDFSSAGEGWGRSELGSHLRIVAMCEWIPTPETRSNDTTSDTDGGRIPEAYIVVDNATHVRVKALLVYASSASPGAKSGAPEGFVAKMASMWAVFFYAAVFCALIVAQPENRILLRQWWKHADRQLRLLLRQTF